MGHASKPAGFELNFEAYLEIVISSGKVLLKSSLQFCLHLILDGQDKESIKGTKNHIKCLKAPFLGFF